MAYIWLVSNFHREPLHEGEHLKSTATTNKKGRRWKGMCYFCSWNDSDREHLSIFRHIVFITIRRTLSAINCWTWLSSVDMIEIYELASVCLQCVCVWACVCVRERSWAGLGLLVCVCDVPSGCELACGVKAMLHAEAELWSALSRRRIMLNHSSPLSHYLHWLLHSSLSPSPSSLQPSPTAPGSLPAHFPLPFSPSTHSSLGRVLISSLWRLSFYSSSSLVERCSNADEHLINLEMSFYPNKMRLCLQ